jgi:large subunit ribosomal protein L25
VNVEVPLEFVGKAKGIIMGGNVRQVFLKLPVRCLPANIPAKLTYDVSGLDVEDTVMVSELTLPQGVTVRLRPSQTVGGCFGNRRKAGDDAEEETAAAAGGDAAAKPGAAAAKPAAAAPKAKGK